MPRRSVCTKYFSYTQKMRDYLRHVSPGEQVPTIEELREILDTSRGTVDRVLESLVKDGLIYRPAGKQRYVVADYADHAVRRIALIRPDYPSPVFEAMARRVVEAGRQDNWAFDLQYYRSMKTLDIRRVIGDNDAAVLVPTSEEIPAHILQALRSQDHPVVMVQENLDDEAIPCVCLDDYKIGLTATEYLLSLGHRDIVLVLDQPHISVTHKRQQGWREALRHAGVSDIDAKLIDCNVQPGEDPKEVTHACLRRWLNQPSVPFTAMVCVSDVGAMAALRALSERGYRVPDDVSVVAHGGESNLGPFLSPPLTAVETDMAAFGGQVITMLKSCFDYPDDRGRIYRVEPALVVRKTTQRLKTPAQSAGSVLV